MNKKATSCLSRGRASEPLSFSGGSAESWPGLGRLYFDSILSRDYPVVLALSLLGAVAGTCIGDDP